MAEGSAVNSPTRAMADVFEAKKKELDDCLAAFSYVPNQKGILVSLPMEKSWDTGPFISSSRRCLRGVADLKLVKSYVMDALPQQTAAVKRH